MYNASLVFHNSCSVLSWLLMTGNDHDFWHAWFDTHGIASWPISVPSSFSFVDFYALRALPSFPSARSPWIHGHVCPCRSLRPPPRWMPSVWGGFGMEGSFFRMGGTERDGKFVVLVCRWFLRCWWRSILRGEERLGERYGGEIASWHECVGEGGTTVLLTCGFVPRHQASCTPTTWRDHWNMQCTAETNVVDGADAIHERQTKKNIQPMKILLVEDDTTTLAVVQALLAQCGYEGKNDTCERTKRRETRAVLRRKRRPRDREEKERKRAKCTQRQGEGCGKRHNVQQKKQLGRGGCQAWLTRRAFDWRLCACGPSLHGQRWQRSTLKIRTRQGKVWPRAYRHSHAWSKWHWRPDQNSRRRKVEADTCGHDVFHRYPRNCHEVLSAWSCWLSCQTCPCKWAKKPLATCLVQVWQ